MKFGVLLLSVLSLQAVLHAESGTHAPSSNADRAASESSLCVSSGTGTAVYIPNSSDGRVLKVSRDGKRVLFYSERTYGVYDTETNRTIYTAPQGAVRPSLSDDGKFLVKGESTGIAVDNLDTSTRHAHLRFQDPPIMKTQISPDGKYLALLGPSFVRVYKTPDLKIVYDSPFEKSRIIRFSPDGKEILIESDEGVKILKTEDGTEVFHSTGRYSEFSPDGSRIYINRAPYLGKIDVQAYSLSDGAAVGEAIIMSGYLGTAPSNSNYATISGRIGLFHRLNLNEGTLASLRTPDIEFDGVTCFGDGNSCLFRSGYSQWVIQTSSAQLIPLEDARGYGEVALSADGSKLYFYNGGTNKPILLKDIGIHCFLDNISVDADSAVDAMTIQRIRSSLCGRPFTAAEWNAVTPDQEAGTISSELAKKFLLRFQKKDGLDPQKHLPIVMGIAKNERFCRNNPALVGGMLENLFSLTPGLYQKFVSDYPWLSDLKEQSSNGVPAPTCRTREEEAHFSSTVRAYVEELAKKNETKSQLSTWAPLLPLRNTLSKLPTDEKEELMHTMVLGMTADAKEKDANLRPIFDSKLAHLILPAIAPIFGENSNKKTNLNVENDHGTLSPVLLSTHPITEHPDPSHSTGENKNAYGFYVQALPKIRLRSKTLDQEVKWKTAGKEYTAQIHAAPLTGGGLVNTDPSIPYGELFSDNELTGMILVGSNSISEAGSLLNNYQQFYTNLGYHFSPGETIEDVPGKFSEMVKNGKLDYFLKEAHSDGDEMNLFRMLKSAKMVKGERTRPDGKKENVYLMYASDSSSRSQDHLLSNQEFGSWMQERVRNGHGTLVYLNSSCWALKNKIPNETAAAGTPKLYNIGAPTCADGLTTLAENQAMYQLLTGFLAGKTNEEIREGMRKDPFYVNKSWDQYVFPDEPEYEKYVLKKLEVPIDVKVDIKDETGAPYHFDVAR